MSYIGIFRLILYVFLLVLFHSPSLALNRDLASDEVAQLIKNIQTNPENIKSRRFLFEFYCKKKDWKSAVNVILPAQEKLTSDELLRLAEAQLEIKDGKGALNVLKYWHSKNEPDHRSKFLEGRGFAILAKKEISADYKKTHILSSVEAFKASIKIKPQQEDAYLEWAKTIRENLSVYAEEAVMIYRKLVEYNGEKKEYLVDRCRYSVEAKYWDDATRFCEDAFDKIPDSAEAAVFLSQAYIGNDKRDLAKQTLLKVVAQNPTSFLARKEMGDFYMNEGNPMAAIEHYSAAVKIDSTSATAYLGQARALYQTKRYDDALVAYQKNCKLSRMVASEFKNSMGQLRNNPPLHNRYQSAIDNCRK